MKLYRSMFYLCFITAIVSVFYLTTNVTSLTCDCSQFPCQTPVCCKSGVYVKDVCNCCWTCAKSEGEDCGGPWGAKGTCGRNLMCYKSCDCKTIESDSSPSKKCVFPFRYNGFEYNECTTDDSVDGQAWCATMVDPDNHLVRGQWNYCKSGCPGTRIVCNVQHLLQYDGKCVYETFNKSQDYNPNISHEFLEGASDQYSRNSPVCRDKDEDKFCRCSKDNNNGKYKMDAMGCISDDKNPNIHSKYCFLENVFDPKNETKYCFEDTTWSTTDGRFVSTRMACKRAHRINGFYPPSPPPPPPPNH